MNFLITGGAGFIGSNLAEELLDRGEKVRILDNFFTGKRENVSFVSPGSIDLLEGDIRVLEDCRKAVEGVDLCSIMPRWPRFPGRWQIPC